MNPEEDTDDPIDEWTSPLAASTSLKPLRVYRSTVLFRAMALLCLFPMGAAFVTFGVWWAFTANVPILDRWGVGVGAAGLGMMIVLLAIAAWRARLEIAKEGFRLRTLGRIREYENWQFTRCRYISGMGQSHSAIHLLGKDRRTVVIPGWFARWAEIVDWANTTFG